MKKEILARDVTSGVLLHRPPSMGRDRFPGTYVIDVVESRSEEAVSILGYPYMHHGMGFGAGRLHLTLKPEEHLEITPALWIY